MAFGFIKKIASLFAGKKTGKNKNGGKKENGGRGNGSRQNANSKRGKNVPQKAGGKDRSRIDNKRNSKPNSAKEQTQRRDGAAKRERFDSGKRKSRDRGKSLSGKNFQTKEGLARPGSALSAKERMERAAQHALWDKNSFEVPPLEGKKRFQDFDLPSEVLHGIAELGFKYCTEIQALSLENALNGKNIAGKAQTGSGKTAAYLVAILTRYLRTPENRAKSGGTPRALVIAPTRELVIQICKDANDIGKYCGLNSLAVYGGMDYDRQRSEVQGVNVDLLVATPGRLLDFVKARVINLSNVDTLVIDEADRMLDMGFIPDVRRLMSYLPPKNKRTTMLYSATLTDTVMKLAMNWMEEPFKAEVQSETNATDTVRQVVYTIRSEDKLKVLYNHISLHPESRAIVFCNRKSTTEHVYNALRSRGICADMLSGDVNQMRRLKVLELFRNGAIKVVVATDVAGRGIDIPGLEYVINYDFPYEAEDYVHRIGRTGRAGNTGIAISFADENESFAIPEIEEYIKEPLKCTMIQDDDPLLKALPPRGAKLADIDREAKATVDAREAVGEEEKEAAAAVTGGVLANSNAVLGNGAPAIIKEDAPQRTLPKFENACEPQLPERDESEIYSEPVKQTRKIEEWKVQDEK